MLRLDIGSGLLPRRGGPGWVHLDLLPYPHVEKWGDAKRRVEDYADYSVDEIYSSHFLEHLTAPLVSPTLKVWHDKLKPGGILEVHVPNLAVLFSRFLASGTVAGKEIALTEIYAHWTEGHPHRWGFDAMMLTEALREAGFVEMETVPAREKTHEGDANLGMRAKKSRPEEAREKEASP